MKKKLLIVVSGAKFFLSHRLSLALQAQKIGYEVHVATPPSELNESIIEKGLSHHDILMDRGGLNPFGDMLSLYSLYRLYKKIKPDIVHLVTIKPILYGGIAAKWAKVPAVVSALSGLGYLFISDTLKIRCLRFFVLKGYRFVFKHPNARVIFQNEDDRSFFINKKIVNEKNAVLIRGAGVDMELFKPAPELKNHLPLIILASRMLWDKGVAEFVEAARLLKQKNVQARFALVGAGDNANPAVVSEEQLKHWSQEGVVEWWGEREDMPNVMRQSHIVCLPSYREGMPRVLIEAAASARAIVTTNTPGCRELVCDGVNGLLVPVKNAQALASALLELINNPVRRQSMGIRGREIVQHDYSLKSVLEKSLGVYHELLKIHDG